jgi:hypothetical protein
MFSVTNQDGNDIFSIARKYERMGIEEIGNFEFIPIELRFLNENSVENRNVSGEFKLFVTKFNDLYGLVKQYEYKADINDIVSNDKKITIDEQFDTAVAVTKTRLSVELEELQTRLTTLFKNKLKVSRTVAITNEKVQYINVSLATEMASMNSNNDIDNYVMRDLLESNLRKFISENISLSQKLDKIRANFNDNLSKQVDTNSNLKKAIIEKIKSDSKFSIQNLLNQETASGIVSELNSLKEATPILSKLIEDIKINFDNWNELILSGSIQQKLSTKFNYTIQDDMDEMVKIIMTKPKRQFKTYEIIKEKIIELGSYVLKLGPKQTTQPIAESESKSDSDSESES